MANSSTGRNVERVGHRGAPRRHLENTLPSFDEALRLGADAVELDVHVTSDGRVVVHHDPAFGRRIMPATLAGRAISTATAAEVAQVDLGNGSKVPFLADVLRAVAGRAVAYVEIKAGDIKAVAGVIDASGATCAMHSFDHEAIAAALEVAPHIPRGVLFDAWPASPGSIVKRTAARDVWPKNSLVTPERVREIHELGCRVIVWTVNDSVRARELAAWGVDGICSDDLTLLGSADRRIG
jgi:glycerophosphoryl diester phosphodiesterase